MAEYRTTTDDLGRTERVERVDHVDRVHVVERRGGGFGRALAIIVLLAVIVVGVLFATGFWTAKVQNGALPDVQVSGGALPKVDVDSKEVVVGTKKTDVDVPKVTTEKKEIDVPVVGVK